MKAVNDYYGCPTGDSVLKSVAARLSAAIPQRGYLARFGGDEFAALLPDVRKERCLEIAKRCHEAVATIALPDPEKFGRSHMDIWIGAATHFGSTPVMDFVHGAGDALHAVKYLKHGDILHVLDIPNARA